MKKRNWFIPAIIVILAVSIFSFGMNKACGQLTYNWLSETISVQIDCETAKVYISCALLSGNFSILCFPEDFDLTDSNLANAISVVLSASEKGAGLVFIYTGISSSEAKSRADAMIPQANAAFDLTFSHFLTNTTGSMVQVHYVAEAPLNMKSYVGLLVSKCLAPGVEGFSEVIPKIAEYNNVTISLAVGRSMPSRPWETVELSAGAIFDTSTGTGSHTFNILQLIGVNSLAPSPYAKVKPANYYFSIVHVSVDSSNPLSLEAYQPSLQSTNPTKRGWIWNEKPNSLDGTFYFGSDSSPVNNLSFTFNGTIVPEIGNSTLLVIMLTIITLLNLKNRKNSAKRKIWN